MSSAFHPTQEAAPAQAPTLPLMHAAFVLAGLGTLLLGPILPLLSARWHLTDSASGLLILAQFVGATLGGSTVSSRLARGLALGLGAAAAGFAAFAWSPGLLPACAALLVGGFGVGRVIAAINITAGQRFRTERASALSWLNFSWSLGALLSPLSAAWLGPRGSLPHLLSGFALLWLLVFAAFLVQWRGRDAENRKAAQSSQSRGLLPQTFVLFALLLVIYGGFETSLGAWLTTYALRDGGSLRLGQYITVLLLVGLTAGRALAAVLLHYIEDRHLQQLALLLSAALTIGLAAAHRPGVLAGLAVLLGVAIAPVFPATFSIVMGAAPSERQAGMILAASGIGASTLPALIGLVSTRAGSLRLALLIPVAAALAMLAGTLWQPRGAANKTAISPATGPV